MSDEFDSLVPPDLALIQINSTPDDDVDDDIFEHISSKQMKYVQLTVNTAMTRRQVAEILDESLHMLTAWDKNPIVNRYMTAYKKKTSKVSMEQAVQQSRILNDMVFAEFIGRFKMSDQDKILIKDNDVPVNIRLQAMRKYADGSTFRDVLEAMKVIGKQYREDLMIEGDQEQDVFVEKTRKTYMRKRFAKNEIDTAFQDSGLDTSKGWAQLVSEDGGVSFTDHQVSEEEYVEEFIQEIETKSILKRRRNGQEEED
jgi:hypothetical protein